MSSRYRPRTWIQTFAWPALLAAITIIALVLGLASDGLLLDGVAVIGLAFPLAVGSIRAWKSDRC